MHGCELVLDRGSRSSGELSPTSPAGRIQPILADKLTPSLALTGKPNDISFDLW
jgi:hypothetical protein